MTTLTAQDILDVANGLGIQIVLTENFDLEVSPASSLLPSHIEMLSNEKPKLVEHLGRQAAKELMLIGNRKALFVTYHAHHFKCAQCISAGKGYGFRCSNGKSLWFRCQLVGKYDD